MTNEVTLQDEYGRRTVFRGELLLDETTDNDLKPQWLDLEVWRTEAGSFVVRRDVQHRVVHATPNCSRIGDQKVRKADEDDTVPCHICAPDGVVLDDGYALKGRLSVDVYSGPEELVEGMKFQGIWTRFSRHVLAEVSKLDPRVDRAWNTVRID